MEIRDSRAVLIVDAFEYVMSLFRYKGLGDINIELCKLYTVITNNVYLLSRIESTDINAVAKFRPELQSFLIQRMICLIRDMIKFNIAYLQYDCNQEFDGCIKIGGWKFKSNQLLTTREYQLLDFEINSIYNHFNDFQKHDLQSSLAKYKMSDLQTILQFLIKHIEMMIVAINTPKIGVSYPIREVHGHDSVSESNLSILALLMIMVVKCLLKARQNIPMTADDKRQLQYDLIGQEFAKYSSVGSMRCQSILCCYKYAKLLPICVINPEGSLDTVEKELLMNTLLLSQA